MAAFLAPLELARLLKVIPAHIYSYYPVAAATAAVHKDVCRFSTVANLC